MVKSEQEIRNLLKQEVADKGSAPAIYFGIFAVFTFFYTFACVEYAPLIKAFSIFIVILSITRIKMIREIQQKNELQKYWNLLRTNIWLNGISWSVILTAASVELKFTGVHFIVVTTVLCGFISASIITLSADMSLFIPFQFLMLGPQMVILFLDHIGENKFGLGPLIPVYAMYLAYQVRQVWDFRHKVIQNFTFQLDLKKSNKDLQASQATQTDQTVKLIHTSRLAALGEMAAGIAHEVNNPLAIISGSLQQLERKIESLDPKNQEVMLKHTQRSQQSIERITKIISGLRIFSQQSDTLPKATVSLEHIIQDTLNFCSEMLKARYVRLDIGAIPNVMINCHPVQISQVLINLIKNAEDALMDEKNEQERWVKLVFDKGNDKVSIHVSNGGTKISKSAQSKLFQPFFTTKAVGKGTGLGLSISRGIMQEHDGDLVFRENENKTTFTIILPVVKR